MEILELNLDVEQIDVSTGGTKKPDPDWTHVDLLGHEHRWHGCELPTLRWVVLDFRWCRDCQEWRDEGEWRVPETGEAVDPGYIDVPLERIFVAGVKTYSGLVACDEKPPLADLFTINGTWKGERVRGEVLLQECREQNDGRWHVRFTGVDELIVGDGARQ